MGSGNARGRIIPKALSTHEKWTTMTRESRYHGVLLEAWCDNIGRIEGNPRTLKGMLYPLDEDVDEVHVAEMNKDLDEIGAIICYEVEGVKYIQITWLHSKYQRLHGNHSKISDYPDPPRATRVQHACDTATARVSVERKGREGKGIEKKGNEIKGREEKGRRDTSGKSPDPPPFPEKPPVDYEGAYGPIVDLIRDHLLDVVPGKKFKPKWRENQLKEVRLMIEKDGYAYQQVETIMKWLTARRGRQAQFWSTNIEGAAKLREQFMKLALGYKADNPGQEGADKFDAWNDV